MRYTPEQIKKLKMLAIDADLDVSNNFLSAAPEALVDVCNGVGSADMPAWAVSLLTHAYSFAQATAANHDVDYSMSDGAEKTRRRADRRFLTNALAEIIYQNSLLSFKTYWLCFKAFLAVGALYKFGRAAWTEAFYQRHKDEVSN